MRTDPDGGNQSDWIEGGRLIRAGRTIGSPQKAAGLREVARSVRLGPNAERDYREALEAVALLHGAVDEPPELVVLKGAVQQHLAKAPPAQMTSSIPTGSNSHSTDLPTPSTTRSLPLTTWLPRPPDREPTGKAAVPPPLAGFRLGACHRASPSHRTVRTTRRRLSGDYLS
jgi:hypothetical protein